MAPQKLGTHQVLLWAASDVVPTILPRIVDLYIPLHHVSFAHAVMTVRGTAMISALRLPATPTHTCLA